MARARQARDDADKAPRNVGMHPKAAQSAPVLAPTADRICRLAGMLKQTANIVNVCLTRPLQTMFRCVIWFRPLPPAWRMPKSYNIPPRHPWSPQ